MKTTLRIEPVAKVRTPRVPTRVEADEQPGLLHSVPKRWQRNAAVMATMSSLAAMASAANLVAPLFNHGDGQGSFGCRATSPPVFLSEADARAVIVDEAKRAGIVFVGGGKTPTGATMDVWGKKPPEKLTFEGVDKTKKVGFVFVSVEDADKWGAPSFSSVSSYDLKPLAEKVRKKITAAKPKMSVGVFYDPMERSHRGSAGDHKLSNREELRKQVRDFVQWLKSQGVI